MADIKTNQSKVYNALKGMGFSGIGASEQEFAAKMSNPKNRAKVYKALSERGYKGIGKDQAAFDTLIYKAPATAEPQPTQTPAGKPAGTVAQPSQPQPTQQPAAQPQKAQQPKQAYKPTDMEMMGFGMTVNSAQGAVDAAKESLDRTIQNQETFRKQQPLGGGVAKSAPKFNAETGQMEQAYITSAGTEHTDKNQAEDIQRRLRDAAWREAHPLEAAERENAQDMRDIRMEAERLTEARRKSEEHDGEGWWETFKRNLGASLVTGMVPMGSNVDRDMVEAEMTRHGAYGAERQGIAKEQDMLLARGRLAEETQQLLADVRRDREIKGIGSGLLRAGGKVLETALNPRTWDFGEAEMATQFAVADAVMKADSGLGLSSNEQKLLDTWAKNAAINSQFADQLSGWTKAGIVAGESLPFMLEMAMNPASGLGEAATAQLMKYSLKKYGTKWVKDHAKSMLAKKIATRLIGDVVGAGVMANTTGLARVAADAQSRMTGQVDIQLDPNGDVIYKGVKDAESPGAAIFKAMASTSIENWSEMAGNYLGFINNFFGKALGKSVVGKAGRKMLAETGSIEGVSLNKAQKFIYELAAGKGIGAFSQGLAQFAKRTQWHGVIGEYLEEEIGNIANAAIVRDMTFDTKEGTGVFNLQQNIDTFCGVALMGGFMSALNTVGYVGHRINYDVDRVSNANAQLFGDDLWRRIRTTIDSSISDPRGLNDTLTDLIRGDGGLFDENGKKAILKYTQAALEKQGAEMAQYQPRMASSSRRKSDEHGGWEVSSLDKNGDVIETQTFETEDEAKAYEGELKMKQQWQDYRDNLSMTNKLSYPEAAQAVDEFIRGLGDGFDYAETVAAINDPKSDLGKRFLQFKTEKILQKAEANRQAIEAFEEENGLTPGTVQWLSEQDPMQLDAEGLAMADQARDFLEGLAYPAGEVHVEHEQQIGADTAQAVVENVISTEEPIDPNNNAGQQLMDAYKASVESMTALFDRNEEIKEEFYRLQGMGLSPQEIISSLDSFRPEEVQTIIDWYNANARYQSFMDEASRQIDRVAHSNRERRTFHGTINGNADNQNVIVISDGTNSYTLVSGNIQMDGGGRITGTDSGLIIGLDENGDFVQLGDGSGYSVMPGAMSLDQWEEMERERLQQQVSLVVDPAGAQAEQEAAAMQQPTEQQAGNVGGEAGANTGTGADETPTPAPVAPTNPINPPSPSGEAAGTPAVSIESVTDKDGIKRYENGVSAEDAVADMVVSDDNPIEIADASIAEADAAIQKINDKPTKTRKDLQERKKHEATKKYYEDLKNRYFHEDRADGTSYTRIGDRAILTKDGKVVYDTAGILGPTFPGGGMDVVPTTPANGEENVNNEPGQPGSEGNIVPSQAGGEIPSGNAAGTTATVEEQKQERIKALKAELGELFDDDFTKANDVFELVSMWIGRKRNLAWDDVNGKRGLQKELGWTRKIGGDTKYIETLLAKNGEGIGVDEFVHMVWESEENTVNGEKRFDTDQIKNALLDLLKSAQSKSDVVDYAVNSRERSAREALEEQKRQAEEETQNQQEAVAPITDEEIAQMESNLPFAAPVEGEDIPENPLTALWEVIREVSQDGNMPAIRLIDTDQMTDSDWVDFASDVYGGAFLSDEDVDAVRNNAMEMGVAYNPNTDVLDVFSGAVTPESLREKLEQFKLEYNGRENEGEAAGSSEGRWDSDVAGVRDEMQDGEGSATPAAAGAAGTEGQGSTEPVEPVTPAEVPQGTERDEYLQPRNEKEEQIIADVMAQLQQEIDAAIKARDKAASDLRKAQEKESDRATDMFSDDEAFQEPGQLFSFEDMGGTDRTQEGVNRRTAGERKTLEEAQKKLDKLQSVAERNSRIRGALDNERRQTSFVPEVETSGTVAGQPQSREEYLASHPLTEEQIMADTEATEDEKLNAIDFLRGEDDSAISRFYYDGIYERAQKKADTIAKRKARFQGKGEKPAAQQEYQPKWQYHFHYDKETGRAWITRDDVSGRIPIGDGRWHLEANSLAELRGILGNPKNNLGELLKEVEAELHNAEALEKLRRENDPMAAIEDAARMFRDEQKSQDQQDIDDALKEFNDFLDGAKGSSVLDKFMRKGLEGNDKAQASLLDAFTLTNAEQRKFLGELLRLASKVGYAYIKSGVHDAQAWSKKMADGIGQKLKEVLGWEDDIIGEFVDEVWQQKYTVDGQRMRLSEHAERLKNNKPADNSVNVNKTENNEPENVVSSQQEASEDKPKTKDGWLKKMNEVFKELCKKYGVPDDPIILNQWGGRYNFDYRITKGYRLEQFEPYYEAYKKKLDDDVEPATEKQLALIDRLAEPAEKEMLHSIKLNKVSASYVISILKAAEDAITSRAATASEFEEYSNELEKVAKLHGWKPASKLEGDSAEFAERQQKIEELSKSIRKELKDLVMWGDKPQPLSFYKGLAKDAGLSLISDTDLQEIIEAEVVNLAREFANKEGWTDQQKFNHIVKLYEKQPSLNARDNDRINKQQYSTPAPMAYLMGRFVLPSEKRGAQGLKGLEPSAGNGMLTLNLPKEAMHVNDIDEMRLSNLAKQGFAEVTSQDGTQPFEQKAYDVVVTNPPFGSVPAKTYDGYTVTSLEQQMVLNALESMKDDGRAAIIIGGNTEYNQNGTIKGKDRAFLNYLYAHYNVVDVINMDGKTLYSRQGTGIPVRMILINGRKEFNPRSFAPVMQKARAERVSSYDELYKRVNDDILSDSNKSAGVHDTESGESNGKHDNGHADTATQAGVRNVQPGRSSGQRQLLDSDGQPVSGGVGSTQRGTEPRTDTSVGGRNDVVHGTGSTATQPGGNTPSSAEQGGNVPNRRNDTERPDGRLDVPVGAGQRGTGTAQSSDGAAVVQQHTEQKAEVKRGLGTEKVPYRKQSGNPFTLQSLMPAEQADVVKKALEDLGDVDQFLVDELGYSSKEELHQALAAEQIDSVAMAIHQMNQGSAFIIGDQTGIGKGRQAAALIRYGVKKGGFPVFITVKKGLFSDMYRDLCDIGSPGLRPFIWSADDTEHSADVTDKNGNVVYKRPSDKEQKRVVDYINKYGKLPPEYDYIITTYDSFKGGTMVYEEGEKKARSFGKKQPTTGAYNSQAKRDALEVLAQNSYVIMDESHNAGGEGSAVSGYLQYITTRAKGVTFLSATFAKRPGNMPIYSLKTAIAKAGVKVGELIDAVKQGGATFQEIMSKALTEAGQMIRRERDMTGVTIDWKGIEDESVIEKQRQQYDTIIGLFNDIIDFQRRYVDPIVNKKNDEAADEQGEVDHTPGTRDMGINNTPFASRTYNMVQQVLLSLKAEEAAKRAIEHLKMGHKPVIALANTNEGAADEVSTGEDMEMPDLSVNLKKGLQGTLRITKKDAFGNSINEMIPFDELSEEGRARYQEIMDAIENASSGLSLSPIDVIKNELKKAGYKVGELTGRKQEFVYNEDGTVKRVKRQDSDKKKVAADFNNGKLDALILNKSAGTGISLHASSKFDDQRQRVMIVAQAQGDVNDEVQIRGRIDRTGQVLRGMYEYVVSQIPSEQRLLMMLKAKLRSLDANTTSSQKSKFNEMQVQDIINKYGDDIVIQYLAEHTDLAAKMVDPLKWGDGLGDGWESMPAETLVGKASKEGEAGKTASKVLGSMALLKVAEQEKMLAEIGDLYQAEIDRLNEMGENDLEITEMPLRAKTLKKKVWEEGVEPGGKNPFADNSYVEEVEMDILKKPMKAEEVKKSQARLLGIPAGEPAGTAAWENYKRGVMEKLDAWEAEKKKDTTETITARAEKKAQAEKEKYIKGAKKAQEKNKMTDAEIEKNGQLQYDHFYKEEMDKLQASLDAIDKQKQAFVDALETFTTDGVYALPTDIYDLGQLSFEPSFGKVIDIKISDNFSTAASTISFATLDGRRKITIPISGMVKQSNGEKRDIKPIIVSQTAQTRNGMFGSNVANMLKVLEQNVDNWDKLTSTATRKKGYIITGNLLKALTSLQKQGAGGKLISYTTDTGEIRQGVLMGDRFDPGKLTSQNPISSAKADLDDWEKGRKITSADGDVTIKADGYGSWMSYTLKVPKSKKKGEKYFNDKVLLSLMDGQFEGSSALKADFKAENLDAVLKRLDELGVTVENKEEETDNADTGRRYDEEIESGNTRKKKGRSVEEVKSIIDDVAKKYKSGPYEVISLKEMGDRELMEMFFPEDMEGATEEEIKQGAAEFRKFHKKSKGCIDRETNEIFIFADQLPAGEEEETLFHENVHSVLEKLYGRSARGVAERFWSSSAESIGGRSKKWVENAYKEQSGIFIHDEWLTYNLADAMVSGDFSSIDAALDETDRQRIDNILKELGYDRRKEEGRRQEKAESGRKSQGRPGKGSVRSGVLSEHQQRIATHIEQLLDKLGTKSRTTVYYSFDDLPSDMKQHIRERERQGKKVRGWYENGRIYLYLPHIDSIYQAERTIWHETVAHHGLRELVGAENYNKLLKRLWLEHRDGDMGKWVTERMQKNGWKLDEAIDEYLARQAEKEPFKEPSLWQRLRWLVADLLRKIGFKSDPTLTDIKYLFWVSQNQLREGDAMSAIKQQAFLFRLERATRTATMSQYTEPYVNMNAATVEDIYNPEAEGANDDGTRYSEETDEEVIERLEKEPKIKTYRAMALIDGKLYPPMSSKADGKLRRPIELGKWEKADEAPDKAVQRNGKWVFKLTKDNGKSLFAAYNPYIHSSTTMLNDQFSEAQDRSNLVVVEVEVPESELTSGYKAEKAKDAVGKLEWKAGIIQGQLTGTREVILSRWDKPVRIVPASEVARHIAGMIKGKVEVMPTNVVTPAQRAAMEKEGVKFIKTDNRGVITEGENKGKTYSSVYGKKAERRYDEDIDDPLEQSEKAVYDERLNRVETVFTEAYQDSMIALKTAQNAIAHDKAIPDSQNAYMAENLMHGKNKNEQDLFNKMFRDPLIATINKIMNATGMNWGDVDRYVYTKSGLERNREFFVRDWLERQRKTQPHSYEDLNPEEQDIFNRKAETIETLFEDGDIETEEQKEKELAKALQEAHREYVDSIEERWIALKQRNYLDLQIGDIDFADYLAGLTNFILDNIDGEYNPSENDYSGFRAMYGDENGKYNEDAIIEELMNTEDAIDETPDGEPSGTVATLWEQIQNATRYGLERYREAGMRSDEQIDRVEQMFHWYVPMRGFKEDKGEDMYQYFTGKDKAKNYVGGLLKHAKGRGSEANYPISTIFAMTYKAISDCNQNLVNQKLYRLCQANPNDLVVLSDSWAKLNEQTGEWEEVAPEIGDDMSEEEIREATLAFEEEMRQLAIENKAKKIKGKEHFDYKPMDKKKKSEHIVDVRINGQQKRMIVVGNPRMAQALNGQLRFEHGRNVFSKWNATIKNFMASVFTSYSPTFALRNMFRDWTHFRTMLVVREGHGYASRANKYYRQSLFKMVGLFKKYRDGRLDENNEMERDFKDFMDNGGITGFVFMQKLDDIQKEMENIYKKQKAGKPIRLNNTLWEKILGAVEALNEGIENNARFATYRASRHYAGRTKARSAYDAKEITVNFNRKGAGGKTAGFKSRPAGKASGTTAVEDAAKVFGVTSQVLGEGRIFFNATVQAIATTFKNFQHADGSLNKGYIAKWAGKYALPPFMFGLALPLINKALAAAFGGDGDDDPYANLPEWTRRRNLCFYIGNGNFITIPIGQELAAFLTLGDIAAGNTYAPDLKPVDKSWDDEIVGVMNTFSPVDISTKITKGGLMEDPISEVTGRTFSVLAPLVAVEQNLAWTGRPIYREDRFGNDQYTPEYQMVYSGTNPVLVNATKLLHELGGGDDIVRGKFEVNPAIIQYLWEQYTGGPGKVFSNTISIGKDAKDILSGNESEFNVRKVEGLKAFVQQGDDRTEYYRANAKYRKYKADAEKLYDAVKGYEGGAAENPEYVLKLEQISKGEDFVRMQIVREADKQLSQINKAANKAEGAERKELRRLYNEQVKAVVDMLDEVGE